MKDGKTFVNGINIYYQIHMCSNAPYLIMMSGLTRDHRIWSSTTIEGLSASFNLVIFDNRGTGQTDTLLEEYSIETLADDVAILMDKLSIDKAYVLGHSMGGFALQYLAAKFPEKVLGLLLFSTAMNQSEFAIKYLNKRLDSITNNLSLEEIIRTFTPMLFAKSFITEDLLKNITEYELSNAYPQSKESLNLQIMACLKHDSSAIINRITAPTLIVTGDEDQIIDTLRANDLAKNIINSKLKILKNVGHMVQLEAPQQFCELIKDFVYNSRSIKH